MLIDWFTVIAQGINFIVLVWLLKRFLYEPVLRAVDEREKKVAAQVNLAELKDQEAAKKISEYQMLQDELTQNRDALMKAAKSEAKEAQLQLLEKGRQQYAQERSMFLTSLEREKRELQADFLKQAESEIFDIGKKAFMDLGGARLEESIYQAFLQRLNQLNPPLSEELRQSVSDVSVVPVVHTRFELSEVQKKAITKALGPVFGSASEIQFGIDANLISGIELRAGGFRIAWSIADYMDSLKKHLDTESADEKKPQ